MSDQVVLAPQEGSQEDFLATASEQGIDITLYGGAAGAGKSHAILLDPLQYIDDPNFYAVFIRKTTLQLEGGLWTEAKALYEPFGIKVREKQKTIIFPSGAKFLFTYCELDKHCDNFQGQQYSAIYFDEFTQFNPYMFQYLRSRMRSKSKNKSYMKCSMNPDRDHFVFDWVEPYLRTEDVLDEHGIPLEDKRAGTPDRSICGRVRYFIMSGHDLHTSWDREELQTKFPRLKVRTYTFIAGTIDDNPILNELEPDYKDTLDSLPPIERQRLRYGNWFARPEGSGYFDRNWCELVPQVPRSATRVRSWDLASTLPSDVNPDPDWTAGVKMSKDRNGVYYIEDSIRFRERPATVESTIFDTAKEDGDDVTVNVPQDPGSAGKSQATQLIRGLAEQGNYARAKPTNKNKVTRFAPFSAAAEAGLVKVVIGSWNNEYFSELEAFIGDGKTKDDQVDATSDSFNTLAEKKHVPSFTPHSLKQINRFTRG